jgi:uncharacterized surface protein with fasciclin (FAS1) repeats
MKIANLALYSAVGTALAGVLFFSPAQADHHEKNEAAQAGMEAKPAAMKDIVDTASSAGSFSTLVTALQAADLVDTLKGDGPFTVFAPTDEAFAKLPEGTLTDLLKPENKAKLQAILTYHVVPGKIMAVDVVKVDSAKTVNGQSLKVSANNGTVMIDEATVTKADVGSSNGVIHVIDTVVLPQNM